MVYRKEKNGNIGKEEAPLVLLIRADERCFLSFLWVHFAFCTLHKTSGGQRKGGEEGVFKATVMWYNTLIAQLRYKRAEVGIALIEQAESYANTNSKQIYRHNNVRVIQRICDSAEKRNAKTKKNVNAYKRLEVVAYGGVGKEEQRNRHIDRI